METGHKECVSGNRQGSNGIVCLYLSLQGFCTGRRVRLHGKNGCFPEDQEATIMKEIIFLTVVVAIVCMMILKMRKSQAEAELVRQKAIKLRKEKEKEKESMMWPVVGINAKVGDKYSGFEEPSISTIEYEPPEQIAS
jgi:hypothetical protein